ncbi:hypothetical protein KJ682_02265 [bacterium]|nr:hypothetical protein [bacterium]
MGSKRIFLILAALLALAAAGQALAIPEIPTNFSYQGMVLYRGVPYDGTADFKFALVDSVSGTYFWSNDGSRREPAVSIPLDVDNGLFSVLIGGPLMADIDPAMSGDFIANQALRVWVDLGEGFVQMGDQPVSMVLFSHRSNFADQSPGPFTAWGQVWSRSGGFKFPDGTVQTTASTGGGGTVGTLDQSYDSGGAGAGRFIIADAGAVSINGNDGLAIQGRTYAVGGVAIGTLNAGEAPLHVDGNNWDLTNTYGDVMIGDPTYSLRFGMATDGLGAGTARIRPVGGTNRLYLGAGIYDVVKVDTVGFHVTKGPFQVYDDGQVYVAGDFGSGQTNAAVRAQNTNAGGIGLWAETQGNDATIVAKQSGTGPLFKGFEGATERFRVDKDGRVVGRYLQVSAGEFQVDADGQTRVVGDFGSGQTGAAFRAENTNAGGIALWAAAQGTDATMVLEQDGTGDMVRGFLNGSLKYRVLNSGEVVTPSVTITGGADLSEPFTMTEALEQIEPGSVLVIDPENPGSLTLSDQPYDKRVAGIASGAGGVNPGLTLSQQGVLDGGLQVALTGRVYVRASAENGAIEPGDMITTSATPGVAMKASDHARSYGAVVGKAMTALNSGEGLVLVLVGLQ